MHLTFSYPNDKNELAVSGVLPSCTAGNLYAMLVKQGGTLLYTSLVEDVSPLDAPSIEVGGGTRLPP